MPLNSDIKFQKALALAASASNEFEAEAAERAARRLMATYNIDPTDMPDRSLYGRVHFNDNALLKRLREEWRVQHPVVAVEQKTVHTDLKSFLSIPFSVSGFIKAAKKNKNKAESGKKNWNFCNDIYRHPD